jgi:uncharacterized protein YjiK
MKREQTISMLILLCGLAAGGACRSETSPASSDLPPWDVDRARVIEWSSEDPSFEQDFALEASGLMVVEGLLVMPSEKYGRLLVLDPAGDAPVRVIPVAVPRHAELEGVALTEEGVLLCDEAHAAVYEVPIDDLPRLYRSTQVPPVPVGGLELEGVSVRGGKIGFEGVEVDPNDGSVFLLLERSGSDDTGCVSRIWNLRLSDKVLSSIGDPVDVELEDCAWRLTGLAWWDGRLIALKTQYPGERYEVVSVDHLTGGTEVLIDLTEKLRALGDQGWSNNVEGIAVAADGSLWLVADNAETGVIDDLLPSRVDSRTLLMHLPTSE